MGGPGSNPSPPGSGPHARLIGPAERMVIDNVGALHLLLPILMHRYNLMRIFVTLVSTFIYAAVYWGQGQVRAAHQHQQVG